MLVEFFVELFFEGLVDASGNAKIPKAIRYVLFSIVCLIPIGFCVFCCFSSYRATGLIGAIVVAIIALFLIALWICGLVKIKKHK